MATTANLRTAERIGAAIAGAALILRAVRRPSLPRLVMAIGGCVLLRQGLAGHRALDDQLGSGRDMPRRDAVREASEDSFPASDPPAWTPVAGLVLNRHGDAKR